MDVLCGESFVTIVFWYQIWWRTRHQLSRQCSSLPAKKITTPLTKNPFNNENLQLPKFELNIKCKNFQTFTPLNPLKLYFWRFFALHEQNNWSKCQLIDVAYGCVKHCYRVYVVKARDCIICTHSINTTRKKCEVSFYSHFETQKEW